MPLTNYPEYENPPVTEVVCGVLFKPLSSLLTPHVGLLWEKFKQDYPLCQEVPPLAPSIEVFEETPERAEITLALSGIPPLPRVWFIDPRNNGIIQIQRDRFLLNWKKNRLEDEYPRYHRVFQLFQKHLSAFQQFLQENQLEDISVLQYELSYVNHILQGEGWDSLADIEKVFPIFSWQNLPDDFPEVEAINWRTTLALPNRHGRLHIAIRNAFRSPDERPLLLFELTARGIGNPRSLLSMQEWFDLAHQFIFQGFDNLASQEIHNNIWRLKK